MAQEDKFNRIMDLEREIALLPVGSIARKNIKGKDYFYRRITIDGKRKEEYIAFEDLDRLRSDIEKRRRLEQELKALKPRLTSVHLVREDREHWGYNTSVRTGALLRAQVDTVRNYRKRDCIDILRDYVFGEADGRVFILYGLRRTGKTTMIRQIMGELSEAEFSHAAFIQIRPHDTLSALDADLHRLEEDGYRYIFIDEVTLLEDFIEGAALFSDIYASSGMKIILSGTDSLGFAFSKEEQLYDRCLLLHTTFIPYREFEEVLGIGGIDEYIRFGGTMSRSGINYNSESIFASASSTNEYIDSAIAKNIQHSLKMYEYGGHFRQLLDLYEKGELTNVINRVVENINHSFTRSVVEKTFRSHDVSVTAANLLRDRKNPIDIKKHIDEDRVNLGIKCMLDILDKDEQTISVSEAHMVQIKEYLKLLDMITDIDLEYLPDVSQKGEITVITQPGLRYAQAGAVVSSLLRDEKFKELSAEERQRILDRLLSEIRGRMMEEIVLLETKMARPDKHVFKLQFAVGKFDMVVHDETALTCDIYEVKYSTEQATDQYRHLIDPEKCAAVVHRYGSIKGKYVIYRGQNYENDGIGYINVEEYLKKLKN